MMYSRIRRYSENCTVNSIIKNSNEKWIIWNRIVLGKKLPHVFGASPLDIIIINVLIITINGISLTYHSGLSKNARLFVQNTKQMTVAKGSSTSCILITTFAAKPYWGPFVLADPTSALLEHPLYLENLNHHYPAPGKI